MRSVVCAGRSMALDQAARLMWAQHVGSLVVVDEANGRRFAVGMLTDRDIVTAVVAKDLQASRLRVGDVMSGNLVTVRDSESVADVMDTMRREGVRRVPVIGADDALVGLVTLDDLLELLAGDFGQLARTAAARSVQAAMNRAGEVGDAGSTDQPPAGRSSASSSRRLSAR